MLLSSKTRGAPRAITAKQAKALRVLWEHADIYAAPTNPTPLRIVGDEETPLPTVKKLATIGYVVLVKTPGPPVMHQARITPLGKKAVDDYRRRDFFQVSQQQGEVWVPMGVVKAGSPKAATGKARKGWSGTLKVERAGAAATGPRLLTRAEQRRANWVVVPPSQPDPREENRQVRGLEPVHRYAVELGDVAAARSFAAEALGLGAAQVVKDGATVFFRSAATLVGPGLPRDTLLENLIRRWDGRVVPRGT